MFTTKIHLVRQLLFTLSLLALTVPTLAITHAHPAKSFYVWDIDNSKWKRTDKYTVPAWDFTGTLTSNDGKTITVRYCINDDAPTTVTLVTGISSYYRSGAYYDSNSYNGYSWVSGEENSGNGDNPKRFKWYSSTATSNGKPLEKNRITWAATGMAPVHQVKCDKLTIPKTVTNGGVTYTVTKIGAFALCNGAFDVSDTNYAAFKSIILPSTITEIGYGAFVKISMTSVNFSALTSLKLIDGYAFESCSSLSSADFSKLTELTQIRRCAFMYSGLSKVDLLNCKKLTFLGMNAFSGCANLKKVYLPESLTTTEGGLLKGCNNLEEVYVTSKIIDRRNGNNFGSNTNNAAIYVPLKYMDYYRSQHRYNANGTDYGPDENGFWYYEQYAATMKNIYPILESGKQYRTFSYDKAVNMNVIQGLYNTSRTLTPTIVSAIDVEAHRATLKTVTGDFASYEGFIIVGTGVAGELYPVKRYTGSSVPAALGDTQNYLEGNGEKAMSFDDKKPVNGKQRYFIMKDGDFYYCTGGTLARWKSYLDVRTPIDVHGEESGQGAKSFSLAFDYEVEEPTAINGVEEAETFGDSGYYTLDGVRVSGQPLKKGIYIRNGKKILVK